VSRLRSLLRWCFPPFDSRGDEFRPHRSVSGLEAQRIGHLMAAVMWMARDWSDLPGISSRSVESAAPISLLYPSGCRHPCGVSCRSCADRISLHHNRIPTCLAPPHIPIRSPAPPQPLCKGRPPTSDESPVLRDLCNQVFWACHKLSKRFRGPTCDHTSGVRFFNGVNHNHIELGR
jgi:hypothetical protein